MVFYKANVDKVAATQRRMYENAVGKAQAASSGGDFEEVELELVDDSQTTVKKNGKAIAPFDYFQAAITEEFAKLTEDEREEYDRQAANWRAEGPPLEQKRRSC